MLPTDTRVFLCTRSTDMRKGFDGLAADTRSIIEQHPASGHLFVFVNRRRDMLKVLYYQRGGLCLWSKRLERGRLAVVSADAQAVQITHTQLMMWIDGIDLNRPQATRFVLPKAA